jgi:K+-transporting ATPase KdpF subunit
MRRKVIISSCLRRDTTSTEGLGNAGFDLHLLDDSFLFDCGWLRAFLRKASVKEMSLETLLGMAVSALLLVYLVYALLRPEKF